MDAQLEQWFATGDQINALYHEELMRSASGPDVTGWLYHVLVGGHDLEWVRVRVRESPEWQQLHATEIVDPGPRPNPGGGGLRMIRVTDERDGALVNRMYSYWSNAWVTDGAIWVFAGHVDGRPRFFKVDSASGDVERVDWFLSYTGTTEGWSWDAEGRIYLLDGPRLRRVDPFTGDDRIVFDISDSHPGCRLWQAHSSDDGQTHCATVERIVTDGAYPKLGTVVFRHGQQTFYEAHGTADESQIDPLGEFLVIKETPAGAERVNNRIINLKTRETRTITNAQGAVGHSDCAPWLLVGEWSPESGTDPAGCVAWDLRQPLVPERRRMLFPTWNMGHLAIRGGRWLLSDRFHLSLVAPDGSGVTRLLAHGMTIPPGTPESKKYDYQVKANLDRTGSVGCYMTNEGGAMAVCLVLF